jgi:hypothetical protein
VEKAFALIAFVILSGHSCREGSMQVRRLHRSFGAQNAPQDDKRGLRSEVHSRGLKPEALEPAASTPT